GWLALWAIGQRSCIIHSSQRCRENATFGRRRVQAPAPFGPVAANFRLDGRPLWRAGDQSGRGRMLANVFSNTMWTRATKAADVPLFSLALTLLFMAAIVALAFFACAGLP